MLFIYSLGIKIYQLIVYLFSFFNQKAKFFIDGRKNIFIHIAEKINPNEKHIWFHFASLGEFEQGRPVLEKIKEKHPSKKFIITFFSPSGYEIRKNYSLAEGIFYLPLDTSKNAEKFIQAINPEIVIFTKYEFWHHYFKVLNTKNIPLYIISAIFRPNQIFFKKHGNFQRNILKNVTHFFVQNTESLELLQKINFKNCSLSGDTRFDRVAENAEKPKIFPLINSFCKNSPTLIAGSTWLEDEQILTTLRAENPNWKFIIAPHEINESHLQKIENLFPNSIRYSLLTGENIDFPQTLIIDNIGILSSVYQYGKIAYIGGGFGAGIHNTLEAAAFGLPIIFGPKYTKFQEAKDLIQIGGAKSINTSLQLIEAFNAFKKNEKSGEIAKKYVFNNKGATNLILDFLKL
ncbi:MAG: 3-deoxy-D-manno-octulosonic acid transferase [Sphingobacteriaceae bacterium]|nr:3-deoxy-D-manno-octulosonic acid transferase [Sphingobacteriaceae bacterium]